jgi:hypothetical protein
MTIYLSIGVVERVVNCYGSIYGAPVFHREIDREIDRDRDRDRDRDIDFNQRIYVGTTKGLLLCIATTDRSMSILWTIDLESPIFASLVIDTTSGNLSD